MATREVLAAIRYIVAAGVDKTDVVIPVATWQKMLVSWKEVVELQKDKEDSAILQDWLQRRAAGTVETVSLDELERELMPNEL